MTPLKAIRQNCLDCMNGNANEVKLCPSVKCPLFPFRFGHNPNRNGIGNHKAVLANSQRTTDGKGTGKATIPTEEESG